MNKLKKTDNKTNIDSSPLRGIRVLELSHGVPGPQLAKIMGDFGADVIKVEPRGGAFERHWSGGKSFVGGVSAILN